MASRTDPGTGRLTAEALARLLARLGGDPERAGEAYEALRATLVKFFDWRGADHPDECADETIDRLAKRLHEGAPVDDPRGYARGIARLVLLERWRRPDAGTRREGHVDLARLPAPPPAETADDDARSQCFAGCLSELPAEGRRLILDYYSAEGRIKIDTRKRLAQTLGLSENALRSRAQRIRDRLERCVARCVGRRMTRNGDAEHPPVRT
jgi:DNA-directed RNA polymerase specialized sigma24 family protein